MLFNVLELDLAACQACSTVRSRRVMMSQESGLKGNWRRCSFYIFSVKVDPGACLSQIAETKSSMTSVITNAAPPPLLPIAGSVCHERLVCRPHVVGTNVPMLGDGGSPYSFKMQSMPNGHAVIFSIQFVVLLVCKPQPLMLPK